MKKIFKTGLALMLGAGLTLGITKALHENFKRDYLKPEDFDKCEWVQFYNKNGRIWSSYMNENIPHNQSNWYLYEKKVKEKNKTLEGYIFLPDLDKDGKVYK